MNVSFNVSAFQVPTQGTENAQQTQQTQQTSGVDKTLTVTITSGKDDVAGPGGTTGITLSYPLIGPEDIAINEFIQQLENMDFGSLKGMTATAAALLVNEMAMELATQIGKGGLDYVKNNAESIKQALQLIENQAKDAETQLFDLINNSTYPDFTEFLKLMLNSAQQLRELASEARHAMVMGEFQNIMDQAEQMMKNAKSNYDAAIKEAEAQKLQSIGKIISGSISILATGVGAIGGGFAGAQFGAQVGTAFGQIVDGGIGVKVAAMQMEAAGFKKDAEEGQALVKKMEAAQKLLQDAQQVLQEFRDIAKSLADMVLKLYQDFIQNQSQIVQRANI